MVLFYCTFGSLKCYNAMTVEVNVEEYKVHGERRLFQAYVSLVAMGPHLGHPFSNRGVLRQIIDDGFKHSLIVYEDNKTKGIRLHAAVWEGELRQCPVWTAFGTQNPLTQSGPMVMGYLTGCSHPPVHIPYVAGQEVESPGLAQGCPSLCVLPGVRAAQAAEGEGRRF